MKNNKLKKVTIILLILLITMIAFLGIYTKQNYSIKNAVKDYQYAMDLSGKRVVTLELDETTSSTIKDAEGNVIESATDEEIAEKGYTKEEVPVNKAESKTIDNYQLTKEIIEKRLQNLNVSSYVVRLDEETGKIVVELPENDKTDSWVSNLTAVGKLEIVDAESGEVLLNNDDIKTSQALRSTTQSGTSIYFSIEFKDKKKLEEITKTYVPAPAEEASNAEETAKTEETSTEGEENSEPTTASNDKKISMKYDGTEMMSTSFEEPLTEGKMYLTVGQASTDTSTLNENLEQARTMASILSNKNLPLTYKLGGNIYVASSQKDTITDSMVSYLTLVVVVSAGILIGKYKLKGLIAITAKIGFIGLLLIVIRYWNVVISTEGIAALIFVAILNFVLLDKMLASIKKEEENKNPEIKKAINSAIIKFTLKIIPLFIIAITFVFTSMASTSSFGMVMFWGLTLIELYNLLITKNLLK
ncbi:MAG: hypothetical protein IKF38_00705 [Clostridia bacterium]|nr:hypothetical protein [Clostridia bacterium]